MICGPNDWSFFKHFLVRYEASWGMTCQTGSQGVNIGVFSPEPQKKSRCLTSRLRHSENSAARLRMFQWFQKGDWGRKDLEIERQLPSGKHTKNYGKSPFLMGKSTISMAIFNSYVSLPEGNDLTSWSQGLYCENLWFTSGTWPRKLADGKHDANFQKPDRPYLVKSLNLSI